MTTHADVIIAGAGPAGSVAAYDLARSGVSVLILEKAAFPRYKVCGAGLTHKILKEIPFDVSPVFETAVHTIRFSTGLADVFSRSSGSPLIYCTMRDRLDAFMLDQAVAAGAKVMFGEKVMDVQRDGEYTAVTTKTGSYRSRLVIGADGASSAVARSAGLRENILPGLAWEAEIAAPAELVKRFSQTVFLDWGSFPGGYGWVFPKADHFSVGVGGPASLSKWMIPYYERFMKYFEGALRESDEGMGEGRYAMGDERFAMGDESSLLRAVSLKSWPIPVRVRESRFHAGNVLVTGDAAGLTDPLTGEGIYYAVRSGRLAAAACTEVLQGTASTPSSYTAAVNAELMKELTEANRIRHIFNTVPVKIHHFVRDSERAWGAFGKILRGERWYADVRKGFGRWKHLWNLAAFVGSYVEKSTERRFRKKGFS
jgi:geranylgeranyl reductase family protein